MKKKTKNRIDELERTIKALNDRVAVLEASRTFVLQALDEFKQARLKADADT